ncbi:MAG: SRPBCC domain-containing protein [Leptospiraceae bacterium]|nr:SRPBCC domain-containing protein [Leptospiraceae bacterium]
MKELKAIELSIKLRATPAQVYRALTSQNELRKWWAPKVIMSRNIVAQEEDRLMEMRLIQSEANEMVRYSWRGQEWEKDRPTTVITLQIEDLGASRSNTGEGLRLKVSHDGWTDKDERDYQAGVWKKALQVLKMLLADKDYRPWWQGVEARGSWRQVKLAILKPVIESIEKKPPIKQSKQIIQSAWRLCNQLDAYGNWYIKNDDSEYQLRYENMQIFSATPDGLVTLHWQDIKQLLGPALDDAINRYIVEQDQDVNPGKTQIQMPIQKLHLDIWIEWCLDILTIGRERRAAK